MRYTTLLFVPLLTVTGLSAQDYLADGPLWRVRSLCGVPAPCIATDNYLYFTAGDSVIEGVTYTKVLRQGSVTYNWQAPPPPLSNCSGTTNYGPDYDVPQLVRQVDRQLRIWDGTADVLLHEFDLVVGSTLPQSWTNWNEEITVSADPERYRPRKTEDEKALLESKGFKFSDYEGMMAQMGKNALLIDDITHWETEKLVEYFKPAIFCAGIKEKYAVQKMGVPLKQLHSYDYGGPYAGFEGAINFYKEIERMVGTKIWKLIKAPWQGEPEIVGTMGVEI